MHAIASVAGEVLVTAVAGQGDSHASARGLAHAVGRHRRAIGEGLVVKPAEPVDEFGVVAADGVGLVSGVCDRIRTEYDRPMRIIGTGGLAPLFAQGDLLFDVIEDDLTMHGLTVIHAHNKKG